AWANKQEWAYTRKQKRASWADVVSADRKGVLAKPQTYMNLSGESVRGLMDFYKIPLDNLLVISDDLDIPPGTLRIREKGGAGGQKGLKSIIEHLGTNEFPRMRFGIGRPPGRMDPADYVLQDFGKDEEVLFIETLDRALKAVDLYLTSVWRAAMNRYNSTAEQADEAARRAETPKPPRSAPVPSNEADQAEAVATPTIPPSDKSVE